MAGTSMGVSHEKKSNKNKDLSCNMKDKKQHEEPELGLELGLMNAQVLDVCSGYDVVKCIQEFCRKRKVGICVLGGTGMVSQATVKTCENTINIHGEFQIGRLCGTFRKDMSFDLSVFLIGKEGRVVAGNVVGEIVALGPLLLVAATPIPKNCELVGHETSG